jgi:hypothetical protein
MWKDLTLVTPNVTTSSFSYFSLSLSCWNEANEFEQKWKPDLITTCSEWRKYIASLLETSSGVCDVIKKVVQIPDEGEANLMFNDMLQMRNCFNVYTNILIKHWNIQGETRDNIH